MHGEARFLHHTNLHPLLVLFQAPSSSAVAGTLVAGALLFFCCLPELARPKVAGVAHLAGKRRRRGSECDRCRRLSRPEKPPESRSKSGLQKSTIASKPALTRAQYPKRKFPKMEISRNGNHVLTLKSELPQVITSSYELRFTRSSRLRTRFDETYNFCEESFPKFRTYKKSNF